MQVSFKTQKTKQNDQNSIAETTSSKIKQSHNNQKQILTIKILTAITITAIIIYMQHFSNNTQNTICNNDRILYSPLFESYHNWIENNMQFKIVWGVIDSLWINIFGYFLSIVYFVYDGSYFEGFFTWFFFSMYGSLCLEMILYQHPIGNLEPGSTPLPSSRPYGLEINDYYFSG